MQKSSVYLVIAVLALLIAGGVYSCKKVNGINNNNIIETPYSLYFSDTSGTLYNSTDGKNYNVVFQPDGFPCRAICTAGPNILWAKFNLYISEDNGKEFNDTYDSLAFLPNISCNNLPLDLNQSMIMNIPSWGRVYTMSNATPGDGVITNYLGLVHSDNNGARGSWILDEYYDTFRTGAMPVRMTSLTQLANGVLCGLALDTVYYYYRNFYKTCKDDPTCRWKESTSNPNNIPTLPQYYAGMGIPLPTYPLSGVPPSGYFTLGHFNNRLIAIDEQCSNGAWFSDDTGKNWAQYSGLPNVPLLCIASPFEQICLVGTDSAGLYTLNNNTNTFVPNNNGLSTYLKVRGIAFKENYYKNNTTMQYIYLATDKGIYQSTDGGHNWIQTIPGNYVAIY